MICRVDEASLAPALDAIYDAAVSPRAWSDVLGQLALLFNSHFVDVFARTDDRLRFHGRALGLDRADYEDEFLGAWSKRNVWSNAKPVRVAGEVMATWQMVDRRDVLRSEMYNEYLEPRGLHEGMRLALWAGDGWIQDISLLRTWSTGPYGEAELALGRFLLPHLQRAAAVSRRLRGMSGRAILEGAGHPAFLLNWQGKILGMNAAGDDLLSRADGLLVRHGVLAATTDAAAERFAAAVAAAGRIDRALPRAASVAIPLISRAGLTRVDVLPVREDAEWCLPGPRSVLVVVTNPPGQNTPEANALMARFGLTPAEADLALDLLSGLPIGRIAASTGRSIHTMRTHLSRVMSKTGTRRQSDLIRLLLGEKPSRGGPSPLYLD
jgi:DNA-binding CsgD family transcriptional regulator